MIRFLAIGALLVALVAAAIIGCGPRAQVAKDKVLEQIDKVLGDLNVKQASIQQKYDKLRAGVEKVRDQRIETQVRLKRIEEEKAEKEAEIAEIKSAVSDLMPLIEQAKESGEYVNPKGRKFTLAELTAKAKELMERHTLVQRQLDNRITSIHKVLGDSFTMLSSQESATKKTLDTLKDKLEEIEEKKSSVQALRDTSAIAGTSSINDELAALNKEVDDMLIDLDVATSKEQEKLNELMEESSVSTTVDINDILEGSASDADDTLDDMKKLIGG